MGDEPKRLEPAYTVSDRHQHRPLRRADHRVRPGGTTSRFGEPDIRVATRSGTPTTGSRLGTVIHE